MKGFWKLALGSLFWMLSCGTSTMHVYMHMLGRIYANMCIHIYIHIYIYIERHIPLSISLLSIYLSTNPSIHQSIYLSVYLSIYLSIYPSIYLHRMSAATPSHFRPWLVSWVVHTLHLGLDSQSEVSGLRSTGFVTISSLSADA